MKKNVVKKSLIIIIPIIILILIAISYAFRNRIDNKPAFELRGVDVKQTNHSVKVKIIGHNSTALPNIPVEIVFPDKNVCLVNATYSGNNTWVSIMPFTQEGLYTIRVKNPYNNQIFEKTIKFYDKPKIFSVNARLNGDLFEVKVKVGDLTGIEKVLLQAFNKNFTLKPVKVDGRGNGVYLIEVKLNSTNNFNYKIIAFDKTNRKMNATYSSTFKLNDYQKFQIYCSNHGLSKETIEKLWNYKLIKQWFKENKLEKILPYIKNYPETSLKILEQVSRDNRIENKETAFKIYENLGKINLTKLTLPQIWLLDNATYYGFYSINGLKKAIIFIGENSLNWNFNRPTCFSTLADTCHFLPNITKYPQETYYLVLQVGDTFYFYKIIETNNKTSIAYIWREAILPYAKWRLNRIKNGTFTPIDQRIKNGDLALLAKWADKKVVEAACRSLYPYDALMDIDLSGKDDDRAFHNGRFKKALQYIINNFKNGHYQKIYQLLMKSKKTKDVTVNGWNLYKEAIKSSWDVRPYDVWVNSGKYWKSKIPELHQKDEDALLVIGYPVAINVADIIDVSGQATPYCSKIIGAMLDRCVVVYRAPYPTYHKGFHDEPMVVGKDGKLIGFWYDLDNFLKDYNPSLNPRAEEYWKDHGPFIKIISFSGGYFTKEKLNKVLNND